MCAAWTGPPKSPDMNYIENAWAVLGARLRARPHMRESTDELLAGLHEEWDGILSSFFVSSWRSNSSGVPAVVSAKGHATKQVNQPLGPREATFA